MSTTTTEDPREEQVKYLARKLKIPRSEASILLENMEAADE